MRVLLLFAMLASLGAQAPDTSGCACDPSKPDSMETRECSLCAEAEKQPADAPYFFLKDSAPHKPNRWLILPRAHVDGSVPLSRMTPAARTALWQAAIDKGRSLWGAQWGLAINSDDVRSQCHPHIHIGKLLEDVETGQFLAVDGAAAIPAPADGAGMWVHQAGKGLHVHIGDERSEFVLMR